MKLKSFTQKDRYGNMTSYEFYESNDNMGVPEIQSIPQHPGGPKGTDTVPAWLTPGEFVMNAEATRMFEPQIEEMNNAGRAIQAQQGGTIPQYEADGGPVYLAEGSGGFFDSLLNMFSNNDSPEVPAATQAAVPPSNTSRADRIAALIEAGKTDGPTRPEPTRPEPTMSNKMYMDFLKDKEGFRNEAYLDSAGVPTIGYGFTEGVQMGDTIDEKTANERLLKEMAKTDQDYNKLVTADLNPNQQASVKSLLYNIGGPQFANSKARAALNEGDFESFKKEAAEFRMADGKVIPGLENRRREELELFFKPYSSSKDDPDDYGDDTALSGPEILKQIVDRETEPVDPNAPEQNETFRSLLSDYGDGDFGQGDAMADAGGVPKIKEPPKVSTSFDKDNLPPGFVLNEKTGKVELAPSNLPLSSAITKESDQAKLTQLESAKERRQSILDNGGGPGDPIFDQEQAYIEKLEKAIPGTKEKVDALTDKTTKVFTDGELKVTDAEIEKKTIQAEKLVDLGLSDAAKKVEQEVKDLKDKKGRLETQSKDLVKDDQTEALDPAVPTIEAAPPKPTATAVAKDIKAIDDGSAKGTKPADAKAAVKKAGSDGADKVTKAEGWLAETFGGLFDAQELKRMAILYAGSRLMGNSHGGSLNWAAEGYLDRVTAHEANVQKLIEKGDYTPTSIQNFKKTKDYSTLIKTGTPIAPTGTKETWYTPEGKRIQAEKYKTGKDSYVWSADGGKTAVPSSWHQDASRVKNTDEYNDRVIKESNYLAERLTEIDESSGNKITSGSIKNGDRKTSYVTGLRPKSAASQVARWAAANGIDVASAEGYAITAFEMAVADANADPEKRKKPTDLRPYLNQLKIRQDTGINELFDITAEDGKITKMDSEKIEEVSRNYLARKGLSGGVSEGDLVKNDATGFTTRRNRNEVNNFWTEASSRWAKKVAEDPSIVDEWVGKAIAGETPFFAWTKANVMK